MPQIALFMIDASITSNGDVLMPPHAMTTSPEEQDDGA